MFQIHSNFIIIFYCSRNFIFKKFEEFRTNLDWQLYFVYIFFCWHLQHKKQRILWNQRNKLLSCFHLFIYSYWHIDKMIPCVNIAYCGFVHCPFWLPYWIKIIIEEKKINFSQTATNRKLHKVIVCMLNNYYCLRKFFLLMFSLLVCVWYFCNFKQKISFSITI